MKMSKKKLKFGDAEVNKKEFHAYKQPIPLNLVDINQLVISDKLKHSDKGYKYFIGYKDNDIIRAIYIVLSQMSGYIKYLNNGGKNMLFKIEDDSILIKYYDIWDKIKKELHKN